MDWQPIDTMPLSTTVEVKTVSGLIRSARTAHRIIRNGRCSCFRAEKGHNTGDLKAVAWRPL